MGGTGGRVRRLAMGSDTQDQCRRGRQRREYKVSLVCYAPARRRLVATVTPKGKNSATGQVEYSTLSFRRRPGDTAKRSCGGQREFSVEKKVSQELT